MDVHCAIFLSFAIIKTNCLLLFCAGNNLVQQFYWFVASYSPAEKDDFGRGQIEVKWGQSPVTDHNV